MSEKELQSLMQRARRSLRSARNLLDDGDHDFPYGHEYANVADWPDRGDALYIGVLSGGAYSPRVVLYRARQ